MKILIADEMHPSLFGMLNEPGWDVDYRPHFTREDIIAAIPNYNGLILRSKTVIDESVLQHAKNLKFIARAGAGLDLIDQKAVEGRNIRLFHAAKGNRDAVGEQAIGMLLGLFANVFRADQQVRNGIWDREGNRGIELMDKTVGIVGYGNNGTAMATKLSGFGCKVIAYDKYRNRYGDQFAKEVALSNIMQDADVLSLHVPLTAETRHLVNSQFIENYSKPFFLINISRGEVVDLEAVVEGLKSGKIRGACLDVLENEKLDQLTPAQKATFDYLRTSDRVVLTPHIAGWTQESYIRINEVLAKELRDWTKSLN
jgi:D-3-phosphoglycerate dehydrogenase